MKKTLIILTILCISISCKNEKSEDKPTAESKEVAINYQSFGDKITDENVLSKSEIIKKYKNLKLGDTVNVKFTSEVKDVCQKEGCWMKMDMGADENMVRFKDHAFFMPKDITGKNVIVEGKAYVEEMSVEDQRHYAEDGGKTAEEIATIKKPKRTLAFEANGVLIPEGTKQ